MKEIKAIIRRIMLDNVMDALRAVDDVPGITVSTVKAFGKTPSAMNWQGEGDYSKMIKLELVVPNEMLPAILQVIALKAHTGSPGDGLIFVSDIGEVIRIGEIGLKS